LHSRRSQTPTLGPVTSLQITRRAPVAPEVIQKRMFDLALARRRLLLATPLLVLVSILIKLDSRGPIFFVQRRYGFNQQPFRIIKFRTMCCSTTAAGRRRADRSRLTGRPLAAGAGTSTRFRNCSCAHGDNVTVGPRPHPLLLDRDYQRRISSMARRHNVNRVIYRGRRSTVIAARPDTDEK